MPLIIAIILIVTVYLWLKQASNEEITKQSNRELSCRKTNSRLEVMTLSKHLLYGKTFDEAFMLTQKELIRAGFSPCIPRSAYDPDFHQGEIYEDESSDISYAHYYCTRDGYSSYCTDSYKYDSAAVKGRLELYRNWKIYHPNEPRPELTDEFLYKDFPKNGAEYNRELAIRTYRRQAVPLGEYITYPGYGVCEVLLHQYNNAGTYGTYVLKVLATDEIIEHIAIGDDKIRRVQKS